MVVASLGYREEVQRRAQGVSAGQPKEGTVGTGDGGRCHTWLDGRGMPDPERPWSQV
jgi:hypothetical protein